MRRITNTVLLIILAACSAPNKPDAIINTLETLEHGHQEIEDDFDLENSSTDFTSHEKIKSFYETKKSDEQVLVKAEIKKVLPDDNEGSRHQRFVIELDNGSTLLVAHNIDLAPRVIQLKKGDMVIVYGEYEWNNRGGVIHWTHHDPAGNHIGGFIEYAGNKYE